MRLAVALLDHNGFGPLIKDILQPDADSLASDEALDDWIYQHVSTAFHSSGTCKMGPESDPMTVVDQYCRVRGVENLRVVDLSISPGRGAGQYQRHRYYDRRAGRRVDRPLMAHRPNAALPTT